MLALIFQSILMVIIGLFLFFASMDVCGAIDRAWTSAMIDYSHRYDYWAYSASGVLELAHNKGRYVRKQ